MSVGTWIQPDHTVQSGTQYKVAISNSIKVAERIARNFAVHEATTPSMSVIIDPGATMVGIDLIERAQQTISSIPAPTGDPRIDRIVLDPFTGDAERIEGDEAVSPVPPDFPGGKIPLARISLAVAQIAITNLDITDERLGGGGAGVMVWSQVTDDVTFTNTNAEQTYYTEGIPGGILGVANALRLTAFISAINFQSNQGCTFRLKYGGTTLATLVIDRSGGPVGSIASFANISLILRNEGATNSQYAIARLEYNENDGTPRIALARGTAAIDSTAAQDLVITVQHTVSNSSNNSTFGGAILERLVR